MKMRLGMRLIALAAALLIALPAAAGASSSVFTNGDLSVVLTLDRSEVDLAKGESITASWTISGGVPPYEEMTCAFRTEDALSDFTNIDERAVAPGESSATYRPEWGKYGWVSLEFADSEGRFIHAEQPFAIINSAAPYVLLDLKLNKTEADAGAGDVLTATATGRAGTLPYSYTFRWYLYDRNKVPEGYVETADHTDKDNVSSMKPTRTGFGIVVVTIRDAAGNERDASAGFTISNGYLPGDADDNGFVDLWDAVSVIDYLIAGIAPTSPGNANAGGTGAIDLSDLERIVDQLVAQGG